MTKNKEEVEKILGKKLGDRELPNHILTSLQFAQNDFVFYRLRDDKAIDKLKERLPKNFQGILIVNKDIKLEVDYIHVTDEEFEKIQVSLVDLYYPLSKDLRFIGVTGTNGKTSTCWFVSQILTQNEKNNLYLGTIGSYKNLKALHDDVVTTTPSYIDLRRLIFKNLNTGYVILELSSHALDQERLKDIRLDAAAWTSFSQDHLDYHQTIDEYFKAKMKIFEYLKEDANVYVPKSQSRLFQMIDHPRAKLATDIFFDDEKKSTFLKARYNQDNFNIALSLVEGFEESFSIDREKLKAPPGRFEVIEKGERVFIVDYAHTPDALEKVLMSTKHAYPEGALWCVFGCGGNRDRLKRKEMGESVSKYAEHIIVTSDNPRDEDPMQIIEDTVKGISKDYFREVDRKKAIFLAYKKSKKGDVIVVAGKGHESYQEIKGQRFKFSDLEVISELKEDL